MRQKEKLGVMATPDCSINIRALIHRLHLFHDPNFNHRASHTVT